MPRESKRKENKPITLEISDVIYAFVGFFMIMISILTAKKCHFNSIQTITSAISNLNLGLRNPSCTF